MITVPGYYCHECAISMGLLNPALPVSLTANEYQLDKYLKHTAPTLDYDFNSIFTDPSPERYGNLVVSALASGSVQIDSQGRKNIVWLASEHTGITYKDGKFLASTDAVKVVLYDDTNKIHGFPIDSPTEIGTSTCASCGRPIPY